MLVQQNRYWNSWDWRTSLDFAFVSSIVLVLGVVFVNGWTDAPNAIGSAVGTRAMTPRSAILMAVVFNFLGVLLMTSISAKVADTISNMVDLTGSSTQSLTSNGNAIIVLAAAMFAIVVWATGAWYFGIPTSESHSLIAGLTGAALALGGFSSVNAQAWVKVLVGLGISSVLGFLLGWILVRIIEKIAWNANRFRAERIFHKLQVAAAALMAFLHGAQDGQKFMGVFMLALFLNGSADKAADGTFIIPIWVMALCSLIMGLGTLVGGKRIIKTIGIDMVKMRTYQGFTSDLAASICLLLANDSCLGAYLPGLRASWFSYGKIVFIHLVKDGGNSMKIGRNREPDYFSMLISMMDCSLRTARALDDLFHDYNDVEQKADHIHDIEHEGDDMLHLLTHELNQAFITPIDREDLMLLGSRIDTVTDAIEDVALTLDMMSVRQIRQDILPISSLMVDACTKLVKAFEEFREFKTSKELTNMLIDVNHDEEAADRNYRKCVKELFSDEDMKGIDIVRWKEIYDKMELVLDTCEDVADALELIAVKNR